LAIFIIDYKGVFLSRFATYYYHAHKDKFNLSTKKSKLQAKGVVEQPDIDLTLRPREWPRVYMEEEAWQQKKDYSKLYYYVLNKEACLERTRRTCLQNKASAMTQKAIAI
jgi:hypothetical protein